MRNLDSRLRGNDGHAPKKMGELLFMLSLLTRSHFCDTLKSEFTTFMEAEMRREDRNFCSLSVAFIS
ncbi:MAG: hypothetical protein C0402_16655 [Thermodesulfovibrio sp.]|nr:hypothetical protein [Thermodesulfovibrio sp.]